MSDIATAAANLTTLLTNDLGIAANQRSMNIKNGWNEDGSAKQHIEIGLMAAVLSKQSRIPAEYQGFDVLVVPFEA